MIYFQFLDGFFNYHNFKAKTEHLILGSDSVLSGVYIQINMIE